MNTSPITIAEGADVRPAVVRCPACTEPARHPAFEGRDLYIGEVGGTFPYVRCAGCASVYGDPQASDAELDAAYAASYGPYSADASPSLLERLGERLAQREATRFAHVAGGRGLLVDVGCGTGAMLRRLGVAEWAGELRGIEPSPEVGGRTAEALGVRVDIAPVEDLPLADGEADAIVLRHVIEHVRDPGAVLVRLHRALRPGGHLYVATPDRRALAERAFGRYWHGYDPPRHLQCFTRDGVRVLLDRAGFERIEERWDFAPQMWSGSLHHALRATRISRWADPLSSLMNPLVGVPSLAGGLLEVALRRSTMYGAIASRPA